MKTANFIFLPKTRKLQSYTIRAKTAQTPLDRRFYSQAFAPQTTPTLVAPKRRNKPHFFSITTKVFHQYFPFRGFTQNFPRTTDNIQQTTIMSRRSCHLFGDHLKHSLVHSLNATVYEPANDLRSSLRACRHNLSLTRRLLQRSSLFLYRASLFRLLKLVTILYAYMF
jgi:hypothetical protein